MPDEAETKRITDTVHKVTATLEKVYDQLDREIVYYNNVANRPDPKNWYKDREYLQNYLRETAKKLNYAADNL